METPPSIPLALAEQVNVLHGKVFYERINAHRLNELIKFEGLSEKFDTKNYAQEKASQYYENEKQQLINYSKNYKKKKGGVAVRYLRTHKSKIGRVYPVRSLGLTCFAKNTRNTLINDTMIDIDMKNAQLQILLDICNSNNIDCPNLEEYSNNREPILKEMMDKYKVSRNACKKLFIRMTLGGTFWGFAYDNSIARNLLEPTEFINDFQNELNKIGNELIADNDTLWKSTKMKIDKDNKKIRDTNTENNKWNLEHPTFPPKPSNKREKSAYGSFLSKILQEWEIRILECMYVYLRDNTNIVADDYFVYEYDGCKLLRDTVNNYGVEKLIFELEGAITNALGFKIKLEVKPMDIIHEKFNCDFVEDVLERPLYEYDTSSYNAMKCDFEEENFKIMSSGNFLCKMNNGTWAFKKKSELITTYEHQIVQVVKENKKTKETEIEDKSFINLWLKDPNIKKYNDVDIYPPPLECPPNVFNLWTPFKGQLLAEKGYIHQNWAIDMVDKHMLTMCDNDIEVFNYLKCWIGQMLKYPAIKTNVPIFTGNQGSGKSSIFKMLIAILGDDKCIETTSPDDDIWGKYNGVLADVFLVIINELEKKQMMNSLGKIKGLVTDNGLTINAKGVPQYKINSFHRFGMTTNKEDPFTTSKDDRRMWIIRVCDILIGNKTYFDKFYDMLKNKDCIATLHNYFYNLEMVDNFNQLPKPVTEYQQILVGINTDIIDDFWRQFSQEHYYREDKIFEEHCSVIYSQFKQFCKDRGCDGIHSNKKFFGSTATKRIKGIDEGQKTNKGSKKIFNISKLVAHYGVICDAKEDDNSDDEYEIE